MSSKRQALILGSSSPRRRELLNTAGLSYEVIKPETEEKPLPGEEPLTYCARNASEKAEWVAAFVRRRGRLEALSVPPIVISADTIVVLNGTLFEKPLDVKHAREMLAALSGRKHTVYTAVTLLEVLSDSQHKAKTSSFTVATEVRLKPLTASEIAAYVQSGEPMDKAGAYAAQGRGSYMVESIHGSYTNVVGLPVAELVRDLERVFAYPFWDT